MKKIFLAVMALSFSITVFSQNVEDVKIDNMILYPGSLQLRWVTTLAIGERKEVEFAKFVKTKEQMDYGQ